VWGWSCLPIRIARLRPPLLTTFSAQMMRQCLARAFRPVKVVGSRGAAQDEGRVASNQSDPAASDKPFGGRLS
jgi:hypothetical protein